MNIPENDIYLSAKTDFQFRIAKKAKQGDPWQFIEEDINSLEEVINKARALNDWEFGVFIEGKMYWSSESPDVFNSTVIEFGGEIVHILSHFELCWVAFLRVNSKQKAELVIRRLSKTIKNL